MNDNTLLLCSDLDRTLLPNGPQPESPSAREYFNAFIAQRDVVLVYVSGRDRDRVRQAIDNYRLPVPGFVISDVGSKIYDVREGDWTVWEQWENEIDVDWNGYSHADLMKILTGLDNLRLQEYSKQNRHKLSYYVPLHADEALLERQIAERLEEKGIRATQIWSIDEPAGIGLLDILPGSASKLHAIEFLMQALGLSERQTVFAGDSGNDLPVLASRIPSILVANAMPSVIESAHTQASACGHAQQLYVAVGGFLGMNGNYSAGVLEGIAHYHPELFEDSARARHSWGSSCQCVNNE